mgnify:CR=1 FL=1
MQRRKYLAALGSLAAGGAAMTGTGAFNFANIERDTNINVANDPNAFLALEATSAYANGSGGKLSLTFDSNANVSGNGINQNSDYSFREVFKITNNGSDPVQVWIEDNESDNNNTVGWFAAPDFDTSIEGSGNGYSLGVGDEVFVNVVILTQGGTGPLPDTINVVADISGA